MKKIKAVSVFTLIIILTMIIENLCMTADAAVTHELYSEDKDIKPGKSFNLYFRIMDEDSLGAVLFRLNYSDSLTFKSAEIEDKTKNEYLRFNDENSTVTALFAVKNESIYEKNIKFRFEQNNALPDDFVFNVEMIEAVDTDDKAVSFNRCSSYIISTVTDDITSVRSANSDVENSANDGSADDSSEKALSSKSNESASKSGSDGQSVSAEDGSIDKEENTKQENSVPVHRFDYQKYRDELTDDTFIYYTAGIIIIIAVVIIIAFGIVRKLNRIPRE